EAGATPIPISVTACGVPLAVSAISTWADREPAPDGPKVTESVQVCPPDKLLPQVLVCEKSPVLLPAVDIPVMLSSVVPGLLIETTCGGLLVPSFSLPKASTVLESLICGAH